MFLGIKLFYFIINHSSCRFNQNISPTGYSNDTNHSINTHYFLLPYLKWILELRQEAFIKYINSKKSGGRVLCGTTKDLRNQKNLAECIETPHTLKVPYFGVSILPREDAETRRPDLKVFNKSKRSGGSNGVMSPSNHARCTTKDLHNQKILAECIETPRTLKVPYFGVSILPREDAKFMVRYATKQIVATHHTARRPNFIVYRDPRLHSKI